jgi:dihydrolipoamide dehydrogenase
MVGPHASDLIAEATLALEMGATLEDLMVTIHPHPTLSEAIMEAAEVAAGAPIHISPPRKKS